MGELFKLSEWGSAGGSTPLPNAPLPNSGSTPSIIKDILPQSSDLISANQKKHVRVIPLNSLKHPKYELKTPIYINIELDEDSTIASFDDIEAFAYADTESEAINQLCDDIVSLYEDLKSDTENLGKLPQKWLICLEEKIKCK